MLHSEGKTPTCALDPIHFRLLSSSSHTPRPCLSVYTYADIFPIKKKKPSIDSTFSCSYHPISSLPIAIKFFLKVAYPCSLEFLSSHSLFNPLQLGCHSQYAVPEKVTSGLHVAKSNGQFILSPYVIHQQYSVFLIIPFSLEHFFPWLLRHLLHLLLLLSSAGLFLFLTSSYKTDPGSVLVLFSI